MNIADFIALDVETANGNQGSICQIGLAAYKDGALVQEWSSLINPEEKFNSTNINIHGLTAADVAEAPILPKVAETLRAWLNRQIVVCHTMFDRQALHKSFAKYRLPKLDCRWLDSCQVAKKTWTSSKNHQLPTICELIGYEFKHHDALEDAKAAGAVILAASQKTGLNPADWL